jgi:ABC-type lipoprotein release transport system permease subunit
MVVGIKDTAKLIGISIIACCAVMVCTMFLNYRMDVMAIKDMITSPEAMMFYNAQVSTSKVVCYVTGGCLLITSVIMLLFYIKHYIDSHKKELGILKALGYSNIKIAKSFWVFGLSVLVGTAAGFASAFILMPAFYRVQNEDKILPKLSIHFHPSLLLYLVIVPAVAFSILSVFYACMKLKKPVLELLRDQVQDKAKTKKLREDGNCDRTFLKDLKRNTLRSRKVLVFFIFFSAFCYSDTTQMSLSMDDLSSPMMAFMIIIIGLILAFITLLLAITTVISSNTKTIAMMRVFGYKQKECCRAILGGYRPAAYVGFALGTVYQYALLKIMVSVVFKDIQNIPEYSFDFVSMMISLVSFAIIYELVMHYYTEKIKKLSIKEIMLE